MWPFKKRPTPPPFPSMQQLLDQHNAHAEAHNRLVREVKQLREDVDGNYEQFVAFRAKTYGRLTRRPGGRDQLPEETSETKAELRARLQREGRLKPTN